MKKWGLWVVLLLLLGGCSKADKDIERGMALRTKLLEADSFSFVADITADYGEKLHHFSMECQADRDGNVTFVVTAPETISGITGRVAEDGGALTFEDTVLYFDLLTDEQISPVSAPWILVRTLRSGYLTSACREDGLLRLTIDDSYEEDALTLDIWLDEQDLPQRGEILYDGRRILTLYLKNVQLL